MSGRNGFIPSHHYAVPWDCLLAAFLEKERLLEEWPGGSSAFGPIMAVRFLVVAFLGFGGSYTIPQFYSRPRAGLGYLREGGQIGFLMLGGVFLCVTGAEALYADMGHFGAKPIRAAWSALVFPSIVLNYAGQAALVLEGAPTTDNFFIGCVRRSCSYRW